MSTVELRIAYVGGGSREWARKLMFDLAQCPDLGGRMALYDIDPISARLNAELGNWLQGQPGVVSRWTYEAVAALGEALAGADFVVLSIQPGTLEMMAEEITVAEEYGMFFPVGDTTGAPGLNRGLRSAVIYAGFAEAIATHCPQAWVVNYTNPMSLCTRTLVKTVPSLKVFGCCHEVFNAQKMLAGLVSRYWGVSPAPDRRELQCDVTGINHFTWIDRCQYDGRDVLELVKEHIARPGTVRTYTQAEVEGWKDWFRSADQVKFALLPRFGMFAAAGDRHLVEFLPGFTRSVEGLFRWGVIRTPVSYRIERWREAPRKTRDLMEGRVPLDLQPSGEEGVMQIRALVGLGELTSNVNLPNRGQVANLPEGAVVETNARFGRNEVVPLAAGALPPGLAPLIARHCADQEMTIDAALRREPELAFQAIYGDPTNFLDVDESWKMFRRLVAVNEEYLPDWKFSGPLT
jgi:alpha-galactosidase/6-phospho-beta-glucosidase family protein